MVAACSPLAQRDGVRVDMPLAEAKSLLRRGSTTFHILPHDPTTDLYTLQQLADRLDCFSPLVGLETDTDKPESILLDIAGLAHLFGSEEKLAGRVQAFCKQQGYHPRTSIADTVGLAWAAVRHQYNPAAQASGSPAHDSPTLENHSLALRACTSSLPIHALRLTPRTLETLSQLGIQTVGQLMLLPRRDLTARFGNEITNRIDQMSGSTPEPIIARRPPPEYYAEQLLNAPTHHRETIEVIIARLTQQICNELSAAQRGALQWTFRLFHGTPLPIKFYVSLFQPTTTPEHVMQLALMQLEQALGQPTKIQNRTRKKKRSSFIRSTNGGRLEVNEITVSVTSSVLLAHRQRKLFDENPRLDQQALAHLINRLSGRLGRHHVVYPTLNSGAQPEYAFKLRPLINPHRRTPRRTDNTRSQPSSHVMARPLKMFNPAVELNAAEHVRSTGFSQPSAKHEQTINSLTFRPQNTSLPSFQIKNSWGPERIETGWWRGRTTRRDYWRIETETGAQFWIYRDLQTRKWFLHGEF